jgi:phage repressor protein C with HTH and peptisase S24 domain
MKLPLYSEKLRKPNLRQWPIVVREVQGHSMIPVLPPGTTVWGITWYMTLVPGDVIIFEHEGREKIKRISEIKHNEVYVLGDFQEESTDSRDYGWVPITQVRARIFHPKAQKERAEKEA